MNDASTTSPSCFRVTTGESGQESVIYRMRGRTVLLVMGLLLAWASGTGVVVVFLSRGLAVSLFEDGVTALMIVAGWVAVTFGAVLFLGMFFLKTMFRLNSEHLTIQKRVLGFSWHRRIERSTMTCIEQVAVPSQDIDGAFDWDLIVRTPHPYRLLDHVEQEATDWLGLKLANFYKVEFRPSSIRDQKR